MNINVYMTLLMDPNESKNINVYEYERECVHMRNSTSKKKYLSEYLDDMMSASLSV